mgnify:CR=1 FL=1
MNGYKCAHYLYKISGNPINLSIIKKIIMPPKKNNTPYLFINLLSSFSSMMRDILFLIIAYPKLTSD